MKIKSVGIADTDMSDLPTLFMAFFRTYFIG